METSGNDRVIPDRIKDYVLNGPYNNPKTPLDKYASLRIFAKIDDVFEILMPKLNLKIPEFKLFRYV